MLASAAIVTTILAYFVNRLVGAPALSVRAKCQPLRVISFTLTLVAGEHDFALSGHGVPLKSTILDPIKCH